MRKGWGAKGRMSLGTRHRGSTDDICVKFQHPSACVRDTELTQVLNLLVPPLTLGLHFHFSLSCIGEGNGNPLQYSCLENPSDGGAWWAAVSGVAQSQTQLKQLMHHPEKPTGSTHSSTSGMSPREQLYRQAEFDSSTQDEA